MSSIHGIRSKRPRRVMFALFLVSLLQLGALAGDPPSKIVITPGQEMAWRKKMMSSFLDSRRMSEDEAMVLRVSRIGAKVAAVSDRPDLVFRFLVVQGDDLQAFSFPGGAVCLTEALVRLFQSDDELAFALGHEISHVVLRHVVSMMSMEQALKAAHRVPEGKLAPVQSFYAHNAELEADTFGALYSTRAGYAFSSAHLGLEKVANVSAVQESDSHPAYQERIATLKQFRTELERAVNLFTVGSEALKAGETGDAIAALDLFVATFPNSISGRFNLGAAYLARVRARSGTPANLAEVLPILPDAGITLRGAVDIVDLQQASHNFQHVLRYNKENTWASAGLAMVLAREARFADSRELLQALVTKEPENTEIRLLLGNVDYLEGNHPAALDIYTQVLKLRPAWPEAQKNMAMTLEETGQTEKARGLWGELSNHEVFGSEARLHLLALEDSSDQP